MLWRMIRYIFDNALFALPLLVGIAAGLSRAGWDSALLPGAGLAFRHSVLLAIALTALASLETATRRGTLYALCATALAGSCGWMIAAPFERGPFVLLLIATLFLLVSNVASARTRPPVVGAYTVAGSAFLFVGNVLLFPDMPSHVVTSWWLGATLFYTLGLHIEKGDLFPDRRERLLLYVLIGLALIGAVLKNYALGAEFGDPYSVTPLLRWGGDRLLGFVMGAAAIWLLARDASDSWQRLCAIGGGLFLALAGGLALYTGEILAGPLYEAIVHAFFVGFAVSLVLSRFYLNGYVALATLLVLYISLLCWIAGTLAEIPLLVETGRTATVPCLVLLAALGAHRHRQTTRFTH